ncbi:hypothetical protein LRAMOSA01334 [Lichtheimia ramosa]|uniref:Sequence orphan n=1 Tax=Lichtheimia ramosa TaxID=688394 RepID=A0A077WJ51_9FUNG|nr:hypothetical protein LRAMOSA01334 [Lichtheimia ramosa]
MDAATIDPFTIDFSCDINDSTKCRLAEEVCKRAGTMLASILDIVQPISVKVMFVSFCQTYGKCGSTNGGGSIILGSARPAISHLMTDTLDGNRVREYPQALLKQFDNINPHPEYSGQDIIAMFNSDADWYFDHENSSPIQAEQTSFLLIVLHEYIHGLGFLSNYSNDLYLKFQKLASDLDTFLTPKRYVPVTAVPMYASAPNLMSPQGFWGFLESAFDKFFYHRAANGTFIPVSAITDYLNQFQGGNILFNSLLEFVADWLNSPQCQVATALAKEAVTPNTFMLMDPNNQDNDVTSALYTSASEFMPGTSISHVDTKTYKDTSDFLMIPSVETNGMTLDDILKTRQATHPLGKHLVQFLTALGYRQSIDAGTSKGLVIYQPPNDLVGTTS